MKKIRPVFYRLFKHLVNPKKCWEWKGALNKDGYGQIGLPKRKRLSAHRAMYLMVYGEIPKRLSVLHSCDNRKCVNPFHLWLGTQHDNMRDAQRKGRLVAHRGEKNPNSVFTWAIVRAMRKMYANGKSQVAIAEKFHTRQGTIGRILRHEGWKEIEDKK